MIEPKRFFEFLNQHSLSADEHAFCYLIFLNEQDSSYNQLFADYWENNKDKQNYGALIRRLEEKGLLEDHNKRGETDISKFKITKKFLKTTLVEADLAFQELKAIHPKQIRIFKDTDRILPAFSNDAIDTKLYYDFIGGDKLKHAKVMEITRQYYGRINNDGYANYKFKHFLENFDGIVDVVEDRISKDDHSNINIFD